MVLVVITIIFIVFTLNKAFVSPVCIINVEFVRKCECSGKDLTKIVAHFPRTIQRAELILESVERIDSYTFYRFENLTSLSLTAPRLTHIDDLAFSGLKLRVLTILNTKLLVINDHILDGLIDLEYLNINHNKQLDKIDRNAFSDIKRLKELNLDHNAFRFIRRFAFEGLNELRRLQLHMNKIEFIDNDAFLPLSKLTILRLEMNNITFLPPKLFHPLKSLKILHLVGNNLSVFHLSTFSTLSALRNLRLDDNCLSAASFDSDFLTYLRNLQYLSFYNNQISRLSTNFSRNIRNMHELISLDMRYNSMTEIHYQAFEGLWNLQTLDISNNKLKRIGSGTFSSLPKLKNLFLSQNYFEQINRLAFKNVTKLSSLSLDKNILSRLRGDLFSDLSELRSLDISGNPLMQLHKDLFTDVPNLVMLVMHNCQISLLRNDQFIVLKKLISINLSNNVIKNISVNTFLHQTRLRYLNLNNNIIHTLPANIFGNLRKLERLYLQNNRIQTLRTTFKTLGHLNTIDLSRNSLSVIHKNLFPVTNNLLLLNLSANRLQYLDRHFLDYNFEKSLLAVDIRLNPIQCSLTFLKEMKLFTFLSLLLDCDFNGQRIDYTNLNSIIMTKPWEISATVRRKQVVEKELITQIWKFEREFKLIFDFQYEHTNKSFSVMNILSHQGMNHEKHIMKIQVNYGVIEIYHQVDEEILVFVQTNITDSFWNTIEITQQKQMGGYKVTHLLNGLEIYSNKSLDVNEWFNVSIYAKYNSDQTVPILITDFFLYMVKKTEYNVGFISISFVLLGLFIFMIIINVVARKQESIKRICIIKLTDIQAMIANRTANDVERVVLEIGIATLNFHVDCKSLVEHHSAKRRSDDKRV